jgi:serine/threonine protein kinase
MVNAPRPVAPLQERLAHSGSLNASIASLSHKDLFGFDGVSAWSDVDVSSWRDPHGHFDTLRLLSRIGHGGYSSVFVAELDAPLILSASASVVTGAGSSAGAPPGHSGGSLVAAKVFLRGAYQDAEEMSRLQTELDLSLSLSNPYVVRTLGMTLLRGPYPVLVMDLMAGSLEDLLYTRTGTHTMPGALKRRLLLEVALGLEFLHSMGVVHRDIKPANVLLDNKIHAKIGDFGIATRFGMESLTASVGTARYMAPEVVFGPYDERADIFAFGMLTWATLHEAVPFGKISPVAAIMRIQCGARPPQTVPDDLANLVPLIEMCWQETPQERPQRMSAIIETLEDCGAVLSDSSGVVDG